MEFLFGWRTRRSRTRSGRSVWLYPAFETGHYIGLSLLVGGIMLIDLRVLGIARALPLKSMIGLLPFVWAGFIINVTDRLAAVHLRRDQLRHERRVPARR